jgi:ankyrin repeat protein
MFRNLSPAIYAGFAFVVLLAFPVHAQETYPPHAIIAASLMGDEVMVRTLLEIGVDIDIRTAAGDTALHIAMFQSNMTVVRLLLNHGFDPNAVNHSGDTPLHRAVAANNEPAVRLLLQFKADKSIRNSAGRTPLDEANRNVDKRRLIFLLR